MTDELQKYVELYRQASEHDTETLWFKVRTIRDAIAAGADRDTLLAECGKESGDSRKQVAKFYAVAMVFRTNEYAEDMDYWVHEVCATHPKVDPNNEDTHSLAWWWLSQAVKGYTTERRLKSGNVTTVHRKHTARTLRRAIRAASGNDGSGKRDTPHDRRERISDVQHDIWAHWMRWVFHICPTNEDGSVTIPQHLVERWQRQINTPYADLTEREKDSDREQADKVLNVLKPKAVPAAPETAGSAGEKASAA